MVDRDLEVVRSRARFVATLRRVADALERREVVQIQVAGKRISIPVKARFSIAHEVEGREAELEMQLSWQPESAPRHKPRAARKTAARKRRTASSKPKSRRSG